MPANGPPCDLNNAFSVAESLGLTVPSMRRPWTGSVAARCHPWAGNAWFHVDLQLFRTSTSRQLLPRRCVEPSRCQMFFRSADPVQVEGRVLSMEGVGSPNSLPRLPRKRVLRAMLRFGAQGRPDTVANWPDPNINAGRSNPKKVAKASPE